MTPSTETNMCRPTAQTQITLKEQSGLGLRCLLFPCASNTDTSRIYGEKTHILGPSQLLLIGGVS